MLDLRHNQVCQILAIWCRRLGASVVLEPTSLDNRNQNRPDLHVILGHQTYLVDVSIVHPTAPSNVVQAARPLNTAKKREQAKIRQYSSMSRQQNAIFVPFVLETFGGFGKRAVRFLKDIAQFADGVMDWDRTEI